MNLIMQIPILIKKSQYINIDNETLKKYHSKQLSTHIKCVIVNA